MCFVIHAQSGAGVGEDIFCVANIKSIEMRQFAKPSFVRLFYDDEGSERGKSAIRRAN